MRKLPPKLRAKLISTIDKIATNSLSRLDIKPLVSKGKFFRCRIGEVRIIFEKRKGENFIHDIGFRGNIYD